MPRQASAFIENTFIRGLITEATGLNFPEQAVTASENVVFDERGIVRRRKGVDFEPNFEQLTADRDSAVVTDYRWDAAGGDGDTTIFVLQVGTTLYFYRVDPTLHVSNSQFDTIDITAFEPAGTDLDSAFFECQYAAGRGYLFVSNPATDSFYVTYDSTGPAVTATKITITTRDFEGVDDSLTLTERPAALTEEHEYNLLNQGWDTDVQQEGSDAFSDDYPLDGWEDARADYPSNADTWFIYFPNNVFDYSALPGVQGNTPSPKGHWILDYYSPDRNSVVPRNPARTITGLTGLAQGRSAGFHRASTIAFFAGRVWYAGTRGEKFSNQILFTQIIERDSQIGECYQQNDPTSSDIADLLPSDGGVILIPDSGTIKKIFAFEDALLCFATNGIWKIAGSEGIGFKATDFSVVKISEVPILTANSFVSVLGVPLFWNGEGIYTVENSQLGNSSVVSLTDNTIREFYEDIPYESKKYARGCYNRRTRVVSWVYRSTSPSGVTQRATFDRVLCLNTLTKAFYNWTFDISEVALNGVCVIVSPDNFGSTTVTGEVTKFIVSRNNGAGSHLFTFADERDDNYVDWASGTDVDFTSSFTTGYKVHGDAQRRISPTYVDLYFKTADEASTVDFQSVWQYANTDAGGKFSSSQRIVADSEQADFQKKRLKTRGSGTAYQFKVTSVAGEPFNLIGWSVYSTQNTAP